VAKSGSMEITNSMHQCAASTGFREFLLCQVAYSGRPGTAIAKSSTDQGTRPENGKECELEFRLRRSNRWPSGGSSLDGTEKPLRGTRVEGPGCESRHAGTIQQLSALTLVVGSIQSIGEAPA
jgi:hypothetical protein